MKKQEDKVEKLEYKVENLEYKVETKVKEEKYEDWISSRLAE